MDDKLVRFFNKINYSNIEAFKDSKVIKVTINTSDDTWNVYIDNKSPVDINSSIELINIAKRGIENVDSINIIFSNRSVSDEDILSYFKYLLNELIKNIPSLTSIINNEITVSDDIITIEVISDIEEKLIKKESKNLIKKLESLGLYDLNINTKINEELKAEVKKEIKEIKVDIVKKEEPVNTVIMGETIKSKVSTIDSIIGEDNNITVEAFVFGTEVFESNKSNFKILTLKISDKTDSILA